MKNFRSITRIIEGIRGRYVAKVEPFQVVPWDVVRARITRLVFRFLRDRATEKCAQFLPARLLSQPLYRVYARARNDTRPPYDTEFSILKATIPFYRDENHLLRIYIYIYILIDLYTHVHKKIDFYRDIVVKKDENRKRYFDISTVFSISFAEKLHIGVVEFIGVNPYDIYVRR